MHLATWLAGRGPSPAESPTLPQRPRWAAPSAGLSRGAAAAPRPVPHSWPLSRRVAGLVPQGLALSPSSLTSCCVRRFLVG